MGKGATLKSYVGFVCLNFHLCCSRNEQRKVYYPRTCFSNCKQKASDSLSRVTKKEKKKKKRCSYKLKQTNKGALTSLKVYIPVVSIWGSCLKLLWVVLVFHLYLYLLWWGTCLGLTLVCISISTSSTAPACLIPVGYVGKICNDVSTYSIPKGYMHHLDLHRIYAYIFNSHRICV